jgi:hypothetical protein
VASRRASDRFRDTSLWPRRVTAYLKAQRSGGRLPKSGEKGKEEVLPVAATVKSYRNEYCGDIRVFRVARLGIDDALKYRRAF